MSECVFVSTNGSPPDLESLVKSPELSFDVEANGLNVGSCNPIGFSLTNSPFSGYYSPIELSFFKGLLARGKLCIAHNMSYDRSMMKKAGVVIDNVADTTIAAHLLQKPSLALKNLSPFPVRSFTELKNGFAGMNSTEMANFTCPHAMAAFALWIQYQQEMKDLRLLDVFWNIEMPLVPVISDMELNGIRVDRHVLEDLGGVFEDKLDTLKDGLDYWSGTTTINYNSPDQVADLFFNKLNIPKHPWIRTSTGRSTTSAKYFEGVKGSHPILPIYLAYKQLMTLRNSYIRSLSADVHPDGRVYGSFNQTGTRTGRLSSSNPNLQKIPTRTDLGRKIRTAFVVPEGKKLLKADYDILELKMLAIASKNPYLLDAFRQGRDIHIETALRVFGNTDKRPEAKTINYQIVYGGGEISKRNMFFVAYPGVEEWITSIHRQAREDGYIRTLNGRIRTINEYVHRWGKFTLTDKAEAHGDREALSTLIQGTSAEVVKIGMRQIWEKVRDTNVKMLLQVHDELLFEVPEDILMDVAKVVKEQLTISKYEIPLTVSIEAGDSWGEMSELAV